MTSTTPSGGAPDSGGAAAPFVGPLGALLSEPATDPYAGLRKLLPKLVQPSWHKHAHSGMYHETRETKPAQESQDPAVLKVKRRKARKAEKRSRIERALAFERTRVARPAELALYTLLVNPRVNAA